MSVENDLSTFEGWLAYQAIDSGALSEGEIALWREAFREMTQRLDSTPPVGRMTLRDAPHEHRYAVAIEDDGALWVTLWIRRSAKGEVFVFQPRQERAWNPHTSYHRDGTLHSKSYDQKMLPPRKRQAVDGFRGVEHLGMFFGHGHRRVGALCIPSDFSAVVIAPKGLLGPRDGGVAVDLVEPGVAPVDLAPRQVVQQETFTDRSPWLVVRLVA